MGHIWERAKSIRCLGYILIMQYVKLNKTTRKDHVLLAMNFQYIQVLSLWYLPHGVNLVSAVNCFSAYFPSRSTQHFFSKNCPPPHLKPLYDSPVKCNKSRKASFTGVERYIRSIYQGSDSDVKSKKVLCYRRHFVNR